jgi:hypothetical protein
MSSSYCCLLFAWELLFDLEIQQWRFLIFLCSLKCFATIVLLPVWILCLLSCRWRMDEPCSISGSRPELWSVTRSRLLGCWYTERAGYIHQSGATAGVVGHPVGGGEMYSWWWLGELRWLMFGSGRPGCSHISGCCFLWIRFWAHDNASFIWKSPALFYVVKTNNYIAS